VRGTERAHARRTYAHTLRSDAQGIVAEVAVEHVLDDLGHVLDVEDFGRARRPLDRVCQHELLEQAERRFHRAQRPIRGAVAVQGVLGMRTREGQVNAGHSLWRTEMCEVLDDEHGENYAQALPRPLDWLSPSQSIKRSMSLPY